MTTRAKPPAMAHTYDFSYATKLGRFRWRYNGQEWLCDRIAGKAWCHLADGDTGHLTLVCKLSIDDSGYAECEGPSGETLRHLMAQEPQTTLPVHHSLSQFPQGKKTHWRMCYYRQGRAWRLRDERDNILYITNGYQGMINLTWMDHGPHVFADQAAYVDSNGIVRFSE